MNKKQKEQKLRNIFFFIFFTFDILLPLPMFWGILVIFRMNYGAITPERITAAVLISSAISYLRLTSEKYFYDRQDNKEETAIPKK